MKGKLHEDSVSKLLESRNNSVQYPRRLEKPPLDEAGGRPQASGESLSDNEGAGAPPAVHGGEFVKIEPLKSVEDLQLGKTQSKQTRNIGNLGSYSMRLITPNAAVIDFPSKPDSPDSGKKNFNLDLVRQASRRASLQKNAPVFASTTNVLADMRKNQRRKGSDENSVFGEIDEILEAEHRRMKQTQLEAQKAGKGGATNYVSEGLHVGDLMRTATYNREKLALGASGTPLLGRNQLGSNIGLKRGNTIAFQRRKEKRLMHLNSEFGRSTTLDKQNRWYLVKHNSTQKKIWETLKFVLLMYQFFYLPVLMAFFEDSPGVAAYAVDKAIDGFLFLDIIVNFFTPVYHNHEMVFNLRTIARTYLTGWFSIDFVTIFPWEEVIGAFNDSGDYTVVAQAIRLLRFMRLAKLVRLFRTFDFKNSDNYLLSMLQDSQNSSLAVIVPNFLLVLLIMHIFACLWYALGAGEDQNNSWININKFDEKPIFDSYIISLYFVVQTFTTTGYGDIISTTKDEQAFRILMMFLAVMLYSLFSGQIVNYRNAVMEKEEILASKLQKLAEIHKQYNIGDVFYRSLIERLQDTLNEQKKENQDLTKLGKEEVDNFEHERMIKKFGHIKLFVEPKNPEWIQFRLKLGREMKKIEYKRDQIIYSKGDTANLFYIISSGFVGAMHEYIEGLPILAISSGFFGEREIIESSPRKYTIRALSDCVLYYVNSVNLKQIFSEDPVFYHQFVMQSKAREENVKKCHSELDIIIRRKVFWRQALSGIRKGNSKSQLNKLVMRDKFKGKKPKQKAAPTSVMELDLEY